MSADERARLDDEISRSVYLDGKSTVVGETGKTAEQRVEKV